MKGFNDTLSVHCLDIARKVYASTGNGNNRALFPKVQAAVELYLTTGEQPYMDFILDNKELIIKQIGRIGWYTARVENSLHNEEQESQSFLHRFPQSSDRI